MSDHGVILRRICSHLRSAELSYALVGGLAVSVRTMPRFTKDVDLAVLVSNDQEAEDFSHELQVKGYRIIDVLESKVNGHLSTVRFVTDDTSSLEADVDLLFSSSGIEKEIVRHAEVIEVLGFNVPVARLSHLLALKVLSESVERKQDRVDIDNLMTVATPNDIAEARSAMELITKRGFNRRKNLTEAFDQLIGS